MSPLRLELAPVTGRVKVLDELKGVAIILIILYHIGGVLSWANGPHGEVGVDLFVIMSGMGLTMSSTVEGAGRFLLRRFWRIYPAYWIVLTTYLLGAFYIRGWHYSTTDIAVHYLGIHAWLGDFYAMSISDSFWFITLIVSLYVIYLPLRPLMDKPDRLLLAGAAISLALTITFLRLNQPVVFGHVALRAPGFFIGLLAGRLLKTGRLEVAASPALAGAFLLVFYGPYLMGFLYASSWVGCALMAAYAFLIKPVLPSAVRSGLRFLGDRSLEIFLIHQPLIREYNVYVLQRYFPSAGLTPTSLTVGICCGLVVTVAASTALHALLRGLPSGKAPTLLPPGASARAA